MNNIPENMSDNQAFRGAKVRRGYFPRHLWRRVSKIAGFKGVSLLAYLWTCEQCNKMGYFPFSLQYAVGDLKISLKDVKKGISDLQKDGYLKYDDTNEVILLHDYMIDDDRIKLSKDSKNLKGCIAYLRQIPASPLLSDFIEEARKHTPDLAKVLLQPSLINSMGYENYIADIRENWKAISPNDHHIHQLTNENGYGCEGVNGHEVQLKPPLTPTPEEMLLSSKADSLPLINESSDPKTLHIRLYPGEEVGDGLLAKISEAMDIIALFKETFQERKGRTHPDLYGEGLVSALESILYWTGEGYDFSQFEDNINQYFNEDFDSNYQIWHFLSGDILKIYYMRENGVSGF